MSQRPRILDAMSELVAARGYTATTVRDIARTAGVSLSSFYEHFEDKEQCFLAAYDRLAEQLSGAIEKDITGLKDAREALQVGIATYFSWFASHPQVAATFVVEVHRAGPRALARRSAIHARFRSLVARALEQPADGSGPVPSCSAMAVIATIDALTHDCLRRGAADELAAQIPDATEVALHILGLQPDRARLSS